ncbi:AraC family transcriptional regulator [Pseudomonas sp. LRF_L74]|uniref:AraC family transcriptional regulator n=1 Tax=Pseudomonas sp. LRF_L74 TaxID=3369422 RepID=UPI003F642D4D
MTNNRLLASAWLPGVELFHADFSGQAFGRHSHDAFAIGAILSGVGGYQCRGARHAIPAGHLSLMNPEEAHTGHAESERLVYRMLYVEESRLPALLGRKRLPRGFAELTPCDDGAVAAGLARVASELENQDGLSLESELLDLLELVFVRHGGLRALPAAGRDSGVIRRLRDYLEAHCTEAISLEAMAAQMQRHPRHLIEAFRQAYGVPPHTYLLQRRIREAKRMLLKGQSLVDVALGLGFYDQAHFSGAFRRFTGVTPGRFQRSVRT